MKLEDVRRKINALDSFPESKITLEAIDELLDVSNVGTEQRMEYANLLDDLIVRLAENYDVVSEEQSTRILKWIEDNWDEKKLDYIDLIISIAMNVSISKATPFIEMKMFSTRDEHTKKLLREAYEEVK